MKSLLTIILFAALSTINIFAQGSLWDNVNESNIKLKGNRYIVPQSYRTVNLDLNILNNLLTLAPLEFTDAVTESQVEILLPMPDGSFQNFVFWESPTMEPELQAKFPEIRTFTGQGIDDPFATLKFDITPEGFHAQILSPNGRVFIDPYSQGDINNYIVYYTKDYIKLNDDFHCNVNFDEYSIPEPNNYSDEPVLPTGPQLYLQTSKCSNGRIYCIPRRNCSSGSSCCNYKYQ